MSRPEDAAGKRRLRFRPAVFALLCLFLARERDPLSKQSIGANELDKVYHEISREHDV
jgi:hypothetical protein